MLRIREDPLLLLDHLLAVVRPILEVLVEQIFRRFVAMDE